ncbi:putative E3 ubiquitin-protein ligase HIP1 isoform X2 [Curcuma longa]|uniref:putative E3 ubiquitin-protein ligase HIP1 isoform X2 n=1 Tax=Curcuma longa TaxID=136217 RepID=UPI003D9DFC09
MQGQRSTFAPFSDIFEIDQPSSSGTSVMDQQMLGNDIPLSVENHDLPCNPLSSNETISCENVVTQENTNLNFWGPLGLSSSTSSLNHGSRTETKLESGWMMSSAPGSRVGGPRIADSRYKAMNTLPFETDNSETSINIVNNRQPSSQFLDLDEPPTEHAEMSRQFLETQLHSGPSNQGPSLCQPVPLSGSSLGGCSVSAINLFSNYDGGKQKIAESSSHKRKNIKQDDGECSASGHSSNFGEGEEINVRISKLPRGATTDHHPYVSASGNSESFQRNTRVKISHANEADNFAPGLWPLENNITCSNPWPVQSSSATASSSQSLYSGYLGINLRPHRQRNPVISSDLYPFPQSGISTMEIGSSLGSPAVAVDVSAVELDQLDVPINISEQVSVPSSSTTDMMRDQTNWQSASGNTVLTSNLVPASQVGANLGLYHQSSGTNWLTQQNRRRISEAIRRNIFYSDFEVRGQTINLPQHQNNSSTSQEVGRRQSGAVSCVHQHPHTRLNMLHRHNSGALGIPLSARTLAAAREGRNRMSGIRNVFDRIRRGDNLLLEDVLFLEQSAFVGGANFLDRYRDMRLDVDNMSYEELLALGERIGSVNTGLSEEKILECLQQHKYVIVASEPTGEVEPCCICREEYIEGEELGQLDCGHDFHSLCIKKWLVIKNLCPICKTTALST